jgi:hypothetical protein
MRGYHPNHPPVRKERALTIDVPSARNHRLYASGHVYRPGDGLGLYCIAMSRAADQVPPARSGSTGYFFLGLLVTLAVFIPAPDLFGPDYRLQSVRPDAFAVDGGPLLIYGACHGHAPAIHEVEVPGARPGPPHLVGAASMVLLLACFYRLCFRQLEQLSIWVLKQILFFFPALVLVAGGRPFATWRRPILPNGLPADHAHPMTLLGVWIGFATL